MKKSSTGEFHEPEESQSNISNADLDPLTQPINEKPYTRPNVKLDPKDLATDIPEPSFAPPPMDLNDPGLTEQPKKPEPKPVNPEMNDMSKKDKKTASGYVANMVIQLYEWLNAMASKGMTFADKKLQKLARDGSVDFSIQIPYDIETGATMSIGEFIKEWNRQNANALTVSDEFKAEVMPVLQRVLEKRGIGMTDEQFLIYLFAKDASLKGMQFFAARAEMKNFVAQMTELTEAMRGAGPQPAPVQTPPPTAEATTGYQSTPPSGTGATIIDVDEVHEEVTEEETPTVAETVDAQLQRKSVAQLRKERGGHPKKRPKGRPRKDQQ